MIFCKCIYLFKWIPVSSYQGSHYSSWCPPKTIIIIYELLSVPPITQDPLTPNQHRQPNGTLSTSMKGPSI